MKRIHFKTLILTFLSILSVSCNDNDNENTVSSKALTLEVNAPNEITKSDKVTFNENDNIGVAMSNTDGSLYENWTDYCKYTYKGRKWECLNSIPLSPKTVLLYAYWPYSSLVSYKTNGFDIPFLTSAQTDWLYGVEPVGQMVNGNSPKARIDMKHVQAKLKFKITNEGYDGIGLINSISFANLSGSFIASSASFDMRNGRITTNTIDNTSKVIDEFTNKNFMSSVLPVSNGFYMNPGTGSIRITIDIDNHKTVMDYNFDSTTSQSGVKRELRAGYEYTLNISMKSNAVTISEQSSIIHDWNGGNILPSKTL